jgi:hypothetical protein
MSIQLNSNLKIAAPAPIDKRYLSERTIAGSPLPYSADTEVYSTIPSTERYTGLTVNILGVEYWFKDNVTTVIKKESGGTITGGTAGLHTSGKSIALGGTLTGDTFFSNGKLRYSTHPFFTNDTDIIDKKYADMVAVGVHPKEAVQVATISSITLATPPATIDGYTLVNMDRVLVKDQAVLTENGIYNYHVSGMTRSSDFDFSPTGETIQGDLIPVITGATNRNTLWVLVEPKYYTGGTQDVKFTLFSSPSFTAGNSITITGSTINVDITTGTLATALGNKLETPVFQSYTGTTAPIIAAALTGSTNGLHDDGRVVGLGGTLTGNTTIETSTSTLKLGTAGKNIIIDPTAILIGECTMASNYIYTSPSETVIDSGAGDLKLCGTNIIVSGSNASFCYASHPAFTQDTQIVDKKYVDDRASGSTVYNCASPSTVTVGGMPASTVLTGRGLDDILQEILVPYLLPAFSSFSNSGVPSTVEVGCVISGSKSFTWGFSNAGNVQPATMCVRDVTGGVTLATNISTTSPQSVAINTTTFSSCGQQQSWCGSAKNTHTTQFNSGSFTTTSLLPYYWGICTCPGPAGANRPTPTCAMVLGGTKVLAGSSGSISVTFNSTDNDYLWFAVPATVSKVCWCTPSAPTNNGAIGGGVNPACNLFPAPVPVSVTTACWAGCSYNVYISNAQTGVVIPMALT